MKFITSNKNLVFSRLEERRERERVPFNISAFILSIIRIMYSTFNIIEIKWQFATMNVLIEMFFFCFISFRVFKCIHKFICIYADADADAPTDLLCKTFIFKDCMLAETSTRIIKYTMTINGYFIFRVQMLLLKFSMEYGLMHMLNKNG